MLVDETLHHLVAYSGIEGRGHLAFDDSTVDIVGFLDSRRFDQFQLVAVGSRLVNAYTQPLIVACTDGENVGESLNGLDVPRLPLCV